jgi:hypothetical protein
LATRALQRCACADRAVAAFIKGSSADLGYVPRGGDLDLQIVVDGDCAGCFEELRLEDIPIEIFCVDAAVLRNVDTLLSDPVLPFYLVRGPVVRDTRGLLAGVRTSIRPRLCAPQFVHARFRSRVAAARTELTTAQSRFDANEPATAAFHLTLAFWHAAAAAAAHVCRPPTTRRCGAVLAGVLTGGGRQDVAALAAGLLNPTRLSSADLAHLSQVLARTDARVSDAVGAMLSAGEVDWAPFPILRSALWPPVARQHPPDVAALVRDTLGWGELSLAARLIEVGTLLMAVSGLTAGSR